MNTGKWYVRRGEKVQGPISSAKLKEFVARGLIKSTDLLRIESSDQWVSPSQIKGLLPDNASIDEPPPLPETGLPSEPEPTGSPSAVPSGQTGKAKHCGLATTSLVLGLLSFCLSIITAIPGLITGIMGLRRINKSASAGGVHLTGKGQAITGIILSSINLFLVFPILVTLNFALLPAVSQARQAARRSASSNNLKQIALGLHNYADMHSSRGDNYMPGDIYDASGRPLLSWRVKILPFIEEQALYEQFHLDEPWDSPHNIQLLPQMPDVYRCPSHPDQTTEKTIYIAPKGSNYYLSPIGKDLGFASVRDGTSNTIAVVQVPASAGIEWTKPDANWSDNNEWIFENTVFPGGFLALKMDGGVSFLPTDFDRLSFNAMLTRNAGDTISDSRY